MKTINLFLMLIILTLVTACSTDDSVAVPEFESDPILLIQKNLDGTFTSTLIANIAHNPEGISIRFPQSSLIPFDLISNGGNEYRAEKEITCLDFDNPNAVFATVIITDDRLDNQPDSRNTNLVILECTNENDDTKDKAKAPYSVGPITLTQTSSTEEAFAGTINFIASTAPSNQERLSMQVTLNGVPQGDSFTNPKLVGTKGTLAFGPIPEVDQKNVDYKMIVSNLDIHNPTFIFKDESGNVIVDSAGNPVTSIDIEFQLDVSNSAIMSSHDVSNPGPEQFTLNGTGIISSSPSNIIVKWFNIDGTIELGSQLIVNTSRNFNFSEIVTTGTLGTTNVVRYYLEGETAHFYETTASSSNLSVNIHPTVTNKTVTLNYNYINNGNQDVNIILTIPGDPNSPYIETLAPTGAQIGTGSIVSDGWSQGIRVVYNVTYKTIELSAGVVTTANNSYLDIDNGNGSALTSGQNSQTFATNFSFRSNGPGTISDLLFFFENDSQDNNGSKPWDYFATIGIDGVANPNAANATSWNLVSPGKWSLPLTSLNIAIADENITIIDILVTTKLYTVNALFNCSIRVIDSQAGITNPIDGTQSPPAPIKCD